MKLSLHLLLFVWLVPVTLAQKTALARLHSRRSVTQRYQEVWGEFRPKTREKFLMELLSKRTRMARIKTRSLEGKEDEGQDIKAQIKFRNRWFDQMLRVDSPEYRLMDGNIVDAVATELIGDKNFLDAQVITLKKSKDKLPEVLAELKFHFTKQEPDAIFHIRAIISKGRISGMEVDPDYFRLIEVYPKPTNLSETEDTASLLTSATSPPQRTPPPPPQQEPPPSQQLPPLPTRPPSLQEPPPQPPPPTPPPITTPAPPEPQTAQNSSQSSLSLPTAAPNHNIGLVHLFQTTKSISSLPSSKTSSATVSSSAVVHFSIAPHNTNQDSPTATLVPAFDANPTILIPVAANTTEPKPYDGPFNDFTFDIKLKDGWHTFLSDRNTPQYKEVATNIISSIKKLLGSDQNLSDVKVLGFTPSPGGNGIITRLFLRYRGHDENPGSKLEAAVKTGNLDGVPVFKDYLNGRVFPKLTPQSTPNTAGSIEGRVVEGSFKLNQSWYHFLANPNSVTFKILSADLESAIIKEFSPLPVTSEITSLKEAADGKIEAHFRLRFPGNNSSLDPLKRAFALGTLGDIAVFKDSIHEGVIDFGIQDGKLPPAPALPPGSTLSIETTIAVPVHGAKQLPLSSNAAANDPSDVPYTGSFIALPHGMPRSCAEIRSSGIGNEDGEYVLEARPGCHLNIICQNMNEPNPKEYLGGPQQKYWLYWHYAVLVRLSASLKENISNKACLENTDDGREFISKVIAAAAKQGNPLEPFKTNIKHMINQFLGKPKRRKRRDLSFVAMDQDVVFSSQALKIHKHNK